MNGCASARLRLRGAGRKDFGVEVGHVHFHLVEENGVHLVYLAHRRKCPDRLHERALVVVCIEKKKESWVSTK